MNTFGNVQALKDAGHFAGALAQIDNIRLGPHERLPADVIRAELLERTGQYAASRVLAENLLLKSALMDPDRSTCELVLARIELECGRMEHGISHLQRSIAIASECHDISRLCWAQLRLLLVLSDRSGPDSVAPLLADLRLQVMKSGDPGIMAALHIHLAETEAKRGLLRNAQRHLDLSKVALATFSNRWLEALSANVESAIHTMRSDFGAASHHARRCRELAEECGAASVHESALGNLGNLAFLSSQFDEAKNCLLTARAVRKGSDNWTACVDTLARIYLAENRLADCEELLNEIDATVTSSSDRRRYVYRHSQLTKVHLRARRGQVDKALEHSDYVLSLADRCADGLLRDQAMLLRADLLQVSGRISEMLSLLGALAERIPNRPPDFYAEYERILACAMARTGQIELAEHHRRRANRWYSGLRHELGQLEVDRSWTSAIETQSAIGTQFNPAQVALGPTVIVAHIASIAAHADRPELIAHELLQLLSACDCVEGAEVRSRGPNCLDALAHFGNITAVEPRHLPIGTDGDREIEIAFTPKTDLESIATINAITLFLATLRDLESARAEREERATLWPVDELPASNDGAVTMGHMRDTMALARRVANANVSVLITGESGTGKEVVARAIHAHSTRAQKPFVPFNCTAVPRELLESQLFGYRRGAFTGAERDHLGVIRSARDGTLFLDEIGEMSLDLQPKLLRFLESGEICPLGDSTPLLANVRVVAATNSRLETLVKEGRFREDLFYRLNVIRLNLRPLRERRDEIPTLINHFLMRAAEEFHKTHVRLAEETVERLLLYGWPGNVRQLQNEIRRMVALADPGTVLKPEALSPDVFAGTSPLPASAGAQPAENFRTGEKLVPALSRVEREMIKAALRDHQGRLEPAARALGISRKGLYLKRQRLGL
jgi:DNA-binding NtrC family response regulator/tetratricopeptide (TPR) repeat protein